MRLLCVLAVSALVFGFDTPPGSARSGVTRVVPSSIDSTGRVDVTAALGRFLAGVPDGETISLARRGRYRVDGTLTLKDRHGLTIDGNGSTIFATTRGDRVRSQISLEGGSDLIVRNLTVKGANPSGGLGEEAYQPQQEAQHGFNLEGVQRAELDRVRVTDVFGDFVYIGRKRPNVIPEDVWIHDSSFARNGRQGIAVSSGRDIVIERNDITDTRRATFDLEPNTPSGDVRNIHILKNRIGPGRLLTVAAHGAGPVNDIVVSGNILHGRPLGIDVKAPGQQHRSGFFVLGNSSSAPAQRGPMRFIRVDSVVVRDNHQQVSRRGEVGVETKDVCGVLVTGNDFGAGTKPLEETTVTCTARRSLKAPLTPSITVGRDRRSRPSPGQAPAPGKASPRSPSKPTSGGDVPVVPIVAVAGVVAVLLGAAYLVRARRS